MIEINGMQAYATDRTQELRTQELIFDGRIKQIIFPANEKYYSLTYYNDKKYFDQQYPQFEEFVNSFKITQDNESEKSSDTKQDEGGGCLIATA
ncbi:MAG: peptidylprolyl isomerase, partial [Nitrosarchaeum sp.]|nr:peptidylprolyl isomerase [Nitrosarchaeum sp.]